MTTGIKNYSTTAGDNDSAPPNGAPEGWFPSDVNAVVRQIMAEVRAWYEVAEWIDFGHAGLTYVDTTNFKMTGDKTTIYHVGRRVRAIGTTPFTIYGRISASAFSSPDTTVTVVWDSGTLNNTLSEVALGSAVTGKPVPITGVNIPDGSIDYDALTNVPSSLPTGVVVPYAGTSAPSGWLFLSGGTIGNGSSGGTVRANADTEDLFTLLWNSFANTQLPIQDSAGSASTRGVSAAADFAANKRLPLLDGRGRVIAGYDSMGGSSANRLTGLTGGVDGDIMGATGGAETHTLTVAQTPALEVTLYDGGIAGSFNGFSGADSSSGGSGLTTSTTGGGGAHNNVQPTLIVPFIIKL